MAQRTTVSLIDDLDSGEADETVNLGLDGVNYTIDLSEKNATILREALAPFVVSARRTAGRPARRASATVPKAASAGVVARAARRSTSGDDTAAVRDWARTHGYKVSDRGRIASSVLDAYRTTH
jgi:hypothetical protein